MRSDADRMAQIAELAKATSIRVRTGVKDDEPHLIDLAIRALSESVDRALGIDEAKIAEIFRRCGDPDLVDMGLVAVESCSGRIVGFLYANGGPHMFAPVAVAVCQIIYVVPEMRWSLAPFLLMRQFVRRAIRGGAGLITAHVTSGVRVRETHAFLTKLNFAPVGGNYVMLAQPPAQTGQARPAGPSSKQET